MIWTNYKCHALDDYAVTLLASSDVGLNTGCSNTKSAIAFKRSIFRENLQVWCVRVYIEAHDSCSVVRRSTCNRQTQRVRHNSYGVCGFHDVAAVCYSNTGGARHRVGTVEHKPRSEIQDASLSALFYIPGNPLVRLGKQGEEIFAIRTTQRHRQLLPCTRRLQDYDSKFQEKVLSLQFAHVLVKQLRL